MSEDALRERVAELEARLERVTRAQAEHERHATDPQGRQWTVSDLTRMGLTRRQALGVIGAIAGGATFASAFSGSAAAQPTGDEGAVGEQGDRVEGWFSEMDALEVATDKLNNTTDILVSGGPNAFLERIDPSTTSTPIQDAINLAADGGSVYPPGGQTIQDTGPIHMQTGVRIHSPKTTIEITGDGNDGLVFDASQATGSYVNNWGIHGTLKLSHQNGITGNTGRAVVHGTPTGENGSNQGFIEALNIDGWAEIPWLEYNGSGSFQNVYHHLGFTNVQTSDKSRPSDSRAALLTHDGGGAGDWIGMIHAYPADDRENADSDILLPVKSMYVGFMNVGGTPGRMVLTGGGGGPLNVGMWRYEPNSQNGTPTQLFMENNGGNQMKIGPGINQGGTVDYIYQFNSGGSYFARPVNGGTVNTAIVRAHELNGRASIYEGLSADVNNTSGGTFSPGVACLGDLTLVT